MYYLRIAVVIKRVAVIEWSMQMLVVHGLYLLIISLYPLLLTTVSLIYIYEYNQTILVILFV